MTNSNNMYGANLKEYALDVLRNKQIARSTFINWQGVIKNLPLENYQFPPNPTEIYNMVSEKYSNPRTKRAILQTLNCLLGIKMKTGKATFPIHDLPDFEEVSSVIQSPKNRYQARQK
jgi:F0F1-type ATP synthase gamma subunit